MYSRIPLSMLSWLAFASFPASAANPLPLPVKEGSLTGDVAFSPDGSLIAASVRRPDGAGSDFLGYIGVFDVSSRSEVKRLEVSSNSMQWLAFSPDGTSLANGEHARDNSELRFWNRSNWRVERRFDGCAQTLDFSADGHFLAYPTDRGDKSYQVVRVRYLRDDSTVQEFDIGRGGARNVSFSPNGNLLCVGIGIKKNRMGEVQVWDIGRCKVRKTLSLDGPSWAIFSPKDPIVAVSTNRRLLLWDLKSERRRNLPSYPHVDACMAFSPDGTLLATSGDARHPSVVIFDVKTGRVQKVLKHTDMRAFFRVAFSPNGKYLATAGDPKSGSSLLLWTLSGEGSTRTDFRP